MLKNSALDKDKNLNFFWSGTLCYFKLLLFLDLIHLHALTGENVNEYHFSRHNLVTYIKEP